MIKRIFLLLLIMCARVTCSIRSCTAGVRGVRSPVAMVLVTLYSDRRVEDAELPLSLSSAA